MLLKVLCLRHHGKPFGFLITLICSLSYLSDLLTTLVLIFPQKLDDDETAMIQLYAMRILGRKETVATKLIMKMPSMSKDSEPITRASALCVADDRLLSKIRQLGKEKRGIIFPNEICPTDYVLSTVTNFSLLAPTWDTFCRINVGTINLKVSSEQLIFQELAKHLGVEPAIWVCRFRFRGRRHEAFVNNTTSLYTILMDQNLKYAAKNKMIQSFISVVRPHGIPVNRFLGHLIHVGSSFLFKTRCAIHERSQSACCMQSYLLHFSFSPNGKMEFLGSGERHQNECGVTLCQMFPQQSSDHTTLMNVAKPIIDDLLKQRVLGFVSLEISRSDSNGLVVRDILMGRSSEFIRFEWVLLVSKISWDSDSMSLCHSTPRAVLGRYMSQIRYADKVRR